MKKRLTEEGVRKLKPSPGKQVTIFDAAQDAKGLVLVVSGGGTKTFYAIHYVASKPRYHKLGRFPSFRSPTLASECASSCATPRLSSSGPT